MTVQDIVAKLKEIRGKYYAAATAARREYVAAVAAAQRDRDLAERWLCEQADLTREQLRALARPAPVVAEGRTEVSADESCLERQRRKINEALRKAGLL
jgi:hypothetical protein